METDASAAPETGGSTSGSAPAPDSSLSSSSSPVAPGAGVSGSSSSAPIGPDKFDWSGWDGKPDALPEPVRPWADGFSRYHADRLAAERAEADRVITIANQILEGRGDPRVKDWEAKHKAEAERAAALQKQYEELVSERDAMYQQFMSREEARLRAETDAFQAQHSWIFDGGKLEQLAGELLDEGFLVKDLPEALKLDEPVLSRAREEAKALAEQGVKEPTSLALRLARAEAGQAPAAAPAKAAPQAPAPPPKPPVHNPAAKTVSGSQAPAPSVTLRDKPASAGKNLADIINLTARNTAKKAGLR